MDLAHLSELRYSRSATLLAARFEDLIDNGTLLAGDILPSTREVAAFLQVSRTTVSRAFNMMEARGLFVARQGQGTIVRSHNFNRAIDFSPSAPRRFEWDARCRQSASDEIYRMHARLNPIRRHDTLTSPDLLPLASWKGQFASIVTDPEIGLKLSRGDSPLGYLPLREAVSGMLQRSKGMMYPAGRIAIYSSAESALQHICALLVLREDKIVFEDSISTGNFEVLNSTGASLLPVHVDKSGLSSEELSCIESPSWLYVSSCGASLSKDRSNFLYEWLRDRNVAVVEEADYAESCAGASPVSTTLSCLAANSHILLYNFSQLLFPLNSFCCLVLPIELVTLFERSKHIFDYRAPRVEDHVVAELVKDGTLEKHRYGAQKILKQRKQVLISELMRHLAPKIKIADCGRAPVILICFNKQWTESEIVSAASDANLPLHRREKTYFATPMENNDFSLNYACMPADELQKRVAVFARKLRFANTTPFLSHDCSNLAV
ncbi:MAG: PLP-dependent aminotransferase family protein [Candidatus Melainabacteria bacterium]|nr:PLP-dependent aminotransferase family protein [Candidatus Melainabacteria bacterium]